MDSRAILKLLQVSGLAPYTIGRDLKTSKKSFILCAYNVILAILVMYNTIWAESDSTNDVDYPNKSFLIGTAFDIVDVLDNVHLCFVSCRSLFFTNVGIGIWFKVKNVNQKLKDLRVKFDDKKLKKLIYLKIIVLVFLSIFFLSVDIFLCSRLNMYYTANYWILCAIPLVYISITEVSFDAFSIILYQRFWVINEFICRAIKTKKDLWNEKTWQQRNPVHIDKSIENVISPEKNDFKYIRAQIRNLRKNRITPTAITKNKKVPFLVMLKNEECFERNLHIGMIRCLKILYFDLYEVASDLNTVFGWNLLFIFASSFFGCTINMYFVIIFHLRRYEAEQYVSCLFWMFVYFFKVLYVMASSNKATKEADRTTDLLHVLLSQTDLNDIQLQCELRTFCLQNSQCKVKFQAAEFFTVDRALLFQFIAGVLSNVVFVVQFDKINFSRK